MSWALLLPWLGLNVAFCSHAAETPPAVGTARWENDIRAFEGADRLRPPPERAVLFIGSSSIRLWKSLAEDFPNQPVINRGFGGSEILDSVYFADRIATPYRPRMILLYAGANDISNGKSPEQVRGDFRAFVAKIHATLPDTKIGYISIAGNPARWSQADRVRQANRLIQDDCQSDANLVFIDVFSPMMGADGRPRPELFGPDRLHMSEAGYSLWREVIGSLLPEPTPDRGP